MALGWHNTTGIKETKWTCGYCGAGVGGSVGYRDEDDADHIYICPNCQKPTAFIFDGNETKQIPSACFGAVIKNLPEEIYTLYEEVKRCVQYTAYTSAVMAMRTLIMHVAVDKGAKTGLLFVSYINYLDAENWIPRSGKEWVDIVRKVGNQAAHEIAIVDRKTAVRLLKFVEMLLQIIYEFPAEVAENR